MEWRQVAGYYDNRSAAVEIKKMLKANGFEVSISTITDCWGRKYTRVFVPVEKHDEAYIKVFEFDKAHG
jgi:hypothetical protein